MGSKSDFMKYLRKDIKNTENKINHMKLCNLKLYVISLLCQSGIALDYAFPFILSAMIVYSYCDSKGNTPFLINDVVCKPSVEMMDTSTGKYYVKESLDYDYDTDISFEHTTGWSMKETGFFERVVTSYRLDESIDGYDVVKLLSMSKEEAEKVFIVSNVETIQKKELEVEDELYTEDMLVVTHVWEDENRAIIREETDEENFISTFVYFIGVFISGMGMTGIKKIVFHNAIKDNLRMLQSKFHPINKEDLEQLKKILLIKKENLELLDESKRSLEEKDKCYKRIRTR